MSVLLADLDVITAGHVPCRPGWDCGRCTAPWPCSPAKVCLAEKLTPELLLTEMIEFYGAASDELDGEGNDIGALWRRFVSWTRSADGRR